MPETAQGSKKNCVVKSYNKTSIMDTEIWNTYNFHLPQNIILFRFFLPLKKCENHLAPKHPRSAAGADPAPRGQFADPCMKFLTTPIDKLFNYKVR